MEKSIIFILLSMLLSCTGNKAYDQQLSKADSIMDIADDSAQIAIKMLDALKPEWSKFTKAQRMRYDLLYHKAMNKAYIDFTSDSTMLAVVDYYEHHGTANDRMLDITFWGAYIEICMRHPWHWNIIIKQRSRLILQPRIAIMQRYVECIVKWDFYLPNNIYLIKN
nr:hypothetical protein [uncultured Prevotella sp.]